MIESNLTASSKIYQAQRIISQAGREISAASYELEKRLKAADHMTLQFEWQGNMGEIDDASQWISLATADVYRVSYKDRRRKPRGTLSFIVDLGSTEHGMGLAEHLQQAVAIVAWGEDCANDPWKPSDFEFPLEAEWQADKDNEAGWLEVRAGGLILYHYQNHPEGDYNGDWWFAYPLDALKEPDDLQNLLIDPFIRLLDGMPPEQAFVGSPTEHLIRFKIDEAKEIVPVRAATT